MRRGLLRVKRAASRVVLKRSDFLFGGRRAFERDDTGDVRRARVRHCRQNRNQKKNYYLHNDNISIQEVFSGSTIIGASSTFIAIFHLDGSFVSVEKIGAQGAQPQ
jgi:hypothetical protein